MNVLAIDSSCHAGSVAFLKAGTVAVARKFSSPRGRGTELFTHLESVLRDCGELDLVVVGTGPGSYNGLRTSIAAAWGIARARGARLAGVSSLLGYEAPEYFVAGDARAGQWFLARVAGGIFTAPPALYSPEVARGLIVPGIPVFAASRLEGLPEAAVETPSAEMLAMRDFDEGHPAPFYLKPPHITKPAD